MAFRHEVRDFLGGFKAGSDAMESQAKGYYASTLGDKTTREGTPPPTVQAEAEKWKANEGKGSYPVGYTPPRPSGGPLGPLFSAIGIGRTSGPNWGGTPPFNPNAPAPSGPTSPISLNPLARNQAEQDSLPGFNPYHAYAAGGVIGDDFAPDPTDYDGDGYPDTDFVFPEHVEQRRAAERGGRSRSGPRPRKDAVVPDAPPPVEIAEAAATAAPAKPGVTTPQAAPSTSVPRPTGPGVTTLASAAPAPVIDTAPAGAPQPLQPKTPQKWVDGPDDYAKALHAGLQYGQQAFHQAPGAIPDAKDPNAGRGAQALQQGVGAMPKEEVAAVNKAVNERPGVPARDDVWGIRMIEAMYRWHMMNGNSDAASKTAFELIQYSGMVAAKLGSQAVEQVGVRDINAATRTVVAALNVVPDGYRYETSPDGKKVIQKDARTGKVKAEHDITPESVFKVALGLADKSTYFSLLQQRVSDMLFHDRKTPEDKALDIEGKKADIDYKRAMAAKARAGTGGPATTEEQDRVRATAGSAGPPPRTQPPANPNGSGPGGGPPASDVPPQGDYTGDGRERLPGYQGGDDGPYASEAPPDLKNPIVKTGGSAPFTGSEPPPGDMRQDPLTGVPNSAYDDPNVTPDAPQTAPLKNRGNPAGEVTRRGEALVPVQPLTEPEYPEPPKLQRGLAPDEQAKVDWLNQTITNAEKIWPNAKQRKEEIAFLKSKLKAWDDELKLRDKDYAEEQKRFREGVRTEEKRVDAKDKANRTEDRKSLNEATDMARSPGGNESVRQQVDTAIKTTDDAYKDQKPDVRTGRPAEPYKTTVFGDGVVDRTEFANLAEQIARINGVSGATAVHLLNNLLLAGDSINERGYRPITIDANGNALVRVSPSNRPVHMSIEMWDQVTRAAAERTRLRVERNQKQVDDEARIRRRTQALGSAPAGGFRGDASTLPPAYLNQPSR